MTLGLGWALNPVPGVCICERGVSFDTQRGRPYEDRAGIGVMCLEAQECPGLAVRSWEKSKEPILFQSLRREPPHGHLDRSAI